MSVNLALKDVFEDGSVTAVYVVKGMSWDHAMTELARFALNGGESRLGASTLKEIGPPSHAYPDEPTPEPRTFAASRL